MNDTRTGADAPDIMQKQTGQPLRVILMESTGTMTSLWLPGTVEGRYFFTDRNDPDRELPVCVLAQDGKWVAVLGADGYFETGASSVGNRVVVEDGLLLKAVFPDRLYILYTEKEAPEDHIFIPCLTSAIPIRACLPATRFFTGRKRAGASSIPEARTVCF